MSGCFESKTQPIAAIKMTKMMMKVIKRMIEMIKGMGGVMWGGMRCGGWDGMG